mmetsp:Transcript_20773/g.59545  ORF Transcript_20773/g.59545 Transcript_20773/m.59545 type:complete len:88 (-) Transcript_20773:86-349(-)
MLGMSHLRRTALLWLQIHPQPDVPIYQRLENAESVARNDRKRFHGKGRMIAGSPQLHILAILRFPSSSSLCRATRKDKVPTLGDAKL